MDIDFDLPRESSEYALKSDVVIGVIQKYAPEAKREFLKISEPLLSANPDELEIWEAKQIDTRKNERWPSENDFRYTLRLLWEETFSVNQFPDRPFRASNGLTTGGMISHFYDFSKVNGTEVADAVNWNMKGENLKEILNNEPDVKQREVIYDWAERLTYGAEYSFRGTRNTSYKSKIIQGSDNGMVVRDDIDTYGVRLLRLVQEEPELTDNLEDPELRKMFGVKEGVKYTKAMFIRQLWRTLSPKAIDAVGAYKLESEISAQEALITLVKIRSHPEMQFLYKYKSPSGFLKSEGIDYADS